MSTQPTCFSPLNPMLEKRAYRSRAKAMKRMRSLPGHRRSASYPYLCETCGLWHLSTPRRMH